MKGSLASNHIVFCASFQLGKSELPTSGRNSMCNLERVKNFEISTSSLEAKRSASELHPHYLAPNAGNDPAMLSHTSG